MQILLPIALLALLVPMFLGVRRQKREAEKIADLQNNLKVGDRVLTTSGLYGTVVDLDEQSVDLEIAEDVVTTWMRQAIRELRGDTEETTSPHDTETAASGEDASAFQTAESGESGQVEAALGASNAAEASTQTAVPSAKD